MNKKLEAKAFDRVKPLFQPGEEPLTATRAQVGKFASGRLSAVVRATAAAEGGLVGGALMANRNQFVVLTNRRLIFLNTTFMGGPGKKVLGEVPAGQFSLAEAKMGLVSLVRIAFAAEGDGVALTFPRVDKKNAEALAAALQPTAPTTA
jgi:hypothetical protein